MKFTLSWLKDHLETDASLDTIVETLIRIGLEVDTVVDPGAKLAPFRVAHVVAAGGPLAEHLLQLELRHFDELFEA